MSTDLSNLDFPSECQRRQVAERVSERLEKIARLREEIVLLTKDNIKDRFYIATHRLLPREVLGEIFVHAANQCCGTWLAPLVISHVSRHWRNVVNSTPRAWGNICIRIIPNPSYSQIVKTWLELSGLSPLHLRFETPHWGQVTREAVRQASLGSYLALLQPHVSRWRSVDILIGDAPHHSIWNIQLLLQQFNFDMPALRSFYLDTTRQLWQDYHILKGDVPLLRRLSIGHCRPSTSNHWLHRLEELDITQATHSLYYIHGLLQACSLLTSLKLDVTLQHLQLQGLDIVQLPHLRNLFLNDVLYLSFLRLPALTSLTFVTPSTTGLQEGHRLITSLQIMLEASSNLSFREMNLVNVEIIRFNLAIKDMPSLEIIRLTNCIMHSEAMDQLSDQSILAKLHTLELFSCESIVESLADLVQDGTWDKPLKRLVFFDCVGVKESLVNRLRVWGMSSRIIYSASSTKTASHTAPSDSFDQLPSISV